jgi:hypothetical protein|tara:strand:- start:348 stop:563 length:216 start_codon:yes stop_codon:yes gene_type:complete
MLNLENNLKKINEATGLEAKKEAMVEMINDSHAKAITKQKALAQVEYINNENKLLSFAYNYAMSGEGLKVV